MSAVDNLSIILFSYIWENQSKYMYNVRITAKSENKTLHRLCLLL